MSGRARTRGRALGPSSTVLLFGCTPRDRHKPGDPRLFGGTQPRRCLTTGDRRAARSHGTERSPPGRGLSQAKPFTSGEIRGGDRSIVSTTIMETSVAERFLCWPGPTTFAFFYTQ